MPFEKVVITHKFGIISQSHKKQLQERLLERRNQLVNSAKKNLKKDENMYYYIFTYYIFKRNELIFLTK